jgi:hypothetical protein
LVEQFGVRQGAGIVTTRHEAQSVVETDRPVRGLKGDQRIMATPRDRQRRPEIGLSETPAEAASLSAAADPELFQMEIESEEEVAGVSNDLAVDLGNEHSRFVRQPVNVVFVPRRDLGQ